MRGILAFLAYQTAWVVCVRSAAEGNPARGVAAIIAVVALNTFLYTANRAALLRVSAAAGVLGVLAETTASAVGAYTFASPLAPPFAWLCPPWLASLWLVFGSVLPSFESWLGRRPWLAAALGATAGPLAYWAGVQMGALTLHPQPAFSLAVIAVIWGSAMPALLALARRFLAPDVAAPAERLTD